MIYANYPKKWQNSIKSLRKIKETFIFANKKHGYHTIPHHPIRI